MSNFVESVTHAFRDLIQRGELVVEWTHHNDRAFGNAVVVLVGKGFRVRLQRDRDDVSADAASVEEPAEWVPLERVLRAVDIVNVRPEGLITPIEAADLVRAHLSEIEAGFSVAGINHTRQRLEELRRQKLAEALKRFPQTS